MNNLLLGPDAQINHTIGLLRTTSTEAPLAGGLKPVPGARLDIDAKGAVTGRCITGGDNVLTLDYVVEHAPGWLALHLSIGGVDLSQTAVFGVACKSRSSEAATYRLCLRSATPEGFVDAFLPKHVVAFAQASTHVDLLKLEGHAHVPAQADWRELILFFQPRSACLDLMDLRVFIV